jgi:hypothetical protein
MERFSDTLEAFTFGTCGAASLWNVSAFMCVCLGGGLRTLHIFYLWDLREFYTPHRCFDTCDVLQQDGGDLVARREMCHETEHRKLGPAH